MIDQVINIIQYGLIGLFGFLFLGWLGFRIPSTNKKPVIRKIAPQQELVPIPIDLPKPFQLHLRQLHPHDLPCPKSLVAWGNGSISSHLPIVGTVWLPISWEIYLKPGEAFIYRVTVTWFTRPFLRGGDQYLQNTGLFKMGKEIVESQYIDQSEFTNLWIYTILFSPSSLLHIPGLKWDHIDENTVWLTVPGSAKTFNSFKLIFDSSSGRLSKIETKRAASSDGAKLDFQSSLDLVHNFSTNPHLSKTFIFGWENVPVLKLSVADFRYHALVDQEIESGI